MSKCFAKSCKTCNADVPTFIGVGTGGGSGIFSPPQLFAMELNFSFEVYANVYR